ncbi:hypothetical protein [Kyrpidia tusciae]|uniref:ABC transporter EcsB n=1 Tax=Kyrpidia tusciae (strain DSM 2912 / NBRC 15312 / T2) TaxID=562970 RepID=D5WSE0_KYRT2|nr:hypothetical protein [Kyrpidia tusciae]ADG05025.1 hypothetical protein Btus_0248 [Kyrpidia tusciae DSM 2912]
MKRIALLAVWTGRRMRSRWKVRLQVLQLVSDWVTVLYLLIPGTIFAVRLLGRYYRGDLTSGLTADTGLLFGIPLRVLVAVVTFAAVLAVHMILYGNVPISLESGDLVFVLLSPLRRSWLLASLWMEGLISSLMSIAAIGILAVPFVRICRVPMGNWFGLLILSAGYEAVIRIAGQLLNVRDRMTWQQWIAYHIGRYLSYLPVGISVGWQILGRPAAGWLVFLGAGGAVSALAVRYISRAEWDGLFQVRQSFLVSAVLPADPDAVSNIQFRMRRISAWLVRLAENLLHRQMHPVIWILLLRALRRKGMFRDLLFFTVVATSTLTIVSEAWIKWIYFGFCVFLFYQWWGIRIHPLYEVPITQQQIVDPWPLRVAAARWRVRASGGAGAVWLLLWALLRRRLIP